MTFHPSIGSRETWTIHEMHRRATSLLATAIASADTMPDLVTEFRDFVVATLEHHHTSEDTDLWPLLTRHSSDLDGSLRELSQEHDMLQTYLDELRLAPIGPNATSTRSIAEAVALRDLVHDHLAHEEPVLLPALDRYISADEWDDFSARTVATTPPEGLHFLVSLIFESGPSADVELIFDHVPREARAAIPERRAAGNRALAVLRATSVNSNGGVSTIRR